MKLADLAVQLADLRNELELLRSRIDCPSCSGKGFIDTGGIGWAHGFPCPQCHGTGLRHTRTTGGPATSQALDPAVPPAV